MPRVYGDYKSQRILFYLNKEYKAPTIAKLLQEEGLNATRIGIHKFIRKFEKFGRFSVRH